MPTALVYTADVIRSINMCTPRLCRQVRKTLFRFGLWRPKCAPTISSSPPLDRRTGPVTSNIRLATLNVQSLTKKHVLVSDLITAHDLDVLVVTESWHVSSSDVAQPPQATRFSGRAEASSSSTTATGSRLRGSSCCRLRQPSRLLWPRSQQNMDRPSSWRYTNRDLLLRQPCSSRSYQLYWNNLSYLMRS